MSDQETFPAEPLGYFVPEPGAQRRPGILIGVAVGAILYGGLWVLRVPYDIREISTSWPNIPKYFSPLRARFMYSNALVKDLLGAFLLLGGILALLLKSMGRRMLLAYAVIFPIFWMMMPILQYKIGHFSSSILPSASPLSGWVTTPTYSMNYNLTRTLLSDIILRVIPSFIMICPCAIVMIVVLTRPSVKRAFGVRDDATASG